MSANLPPAEEISPQRVLENKQELQVWVAVLDELSERTRDVVMLYRPEFLGNLFADGVIVLRKWC
jgi:hypothetical protein